MRVLNLVGPRTRNAMMAIPFILPHSAAIAKPPVQSAMPQSISLIREACEGLKAARTPVDVWKMAERCPSAKASFKTPKESITTVHSANDGSMIIKIADRQYSPKAVLTVGADKTSLSITVFGNNNTSRTINLPQLKKGDKIMAISGNPNKSYDSAPFAIKVQDRFGNYYKKIVLVGGYGDSRVYYTGVATKIKSVPKYGSIFTAETVTFNDGTTVLTEYNPQNNKMFQVYKDFKGKITETYWESPRYYKINS